MELINTLTETLARLAGVNPVTLYWPMAIGFILLVARKASR